jgi:hypothetical protein
LRAACILLLMMAALDTSAHAQQPTRPPGDTARAEPPFSPADTVAAALSGRALTPARAFVRSLLVPGWGQFSQGAKVRGSVYASLQGASAFMLVKTQLKISDARKEVRTLRELSIDSMRADAAERQDTALIRRLSDPDTARIRADSTPAVVDKQSLTDARRRQREDWIALAIFFTLASGVDAYVGAHLSDFPGSVNAQPLRHGGVRIEWTMPVNSGEAVAALRGALRALHRKPTSRSGIR